MFQETAHYIGLLIRKNMLLNRKVEELEEQMEDLTNKNKANE
jgi:hypothetical protein